MRSPVNWAVLGLTIERPSYGYEILQRFERNYGELLKLSSPSQIYKALDSLMELVPEVLVYQRKESFDLLGFERALVGGGEDLEDVAGA